MWGDPLAAVYEDGKFPKKKIHSSRKKVNPFVNPSPWKKAGQAGTKPLWGSGGDRPPTKKAT